MKWVKPFAIGYEYATDKIYNLIGNEGNKYRAHCYKW